MPVMTPASALRHTTLDLLDLVQTVSGFPAVVTANRDLPTTAALRMARGQSAVHTIEYNPELAAEPDYYVVVQCGQILRFFGPPAAQRKDLSGSARGLAAVRELVQREVVQRRSGITAEVGDAFAAQLYNGLLLQLRSMPAELRVEGWISETYPEFESVQRLAVLRQLEENTLVLSPSAHAPSHVFKATANMNAAVAQYWAGVLLQADLVKPYARAGFAEAGASLLAIWRQAPPDPSAAQHGQLAEPRFARPAAELLPNTLEEVA